MKKLFLSVIATLTLLAAVSVKAECDTVMLQSDSILYDRQIATFKSTVFKSYATEDADYGIRMTSIAPDHQFTDPFGKVHDGDSSYRYDIYQNGQIIASTRAASVDELFSDSLKNELVVLLNQLGCR